MHTGISKIKDIIINLNCNFHQWIYEQQHEYFVKIIQKFNGTNILLLALMKKLNFQNGKIDKSTYLLHCILPHKQQYLLTILL